MVRRVHRVGPLISMIKVVVFHCLVTYSLSFSDSFEVVDLIKVEFLDIVDQKSDHDQFHIGLGFLLAIVDYHL